MYLLLVVGRIGPAAASTRWIVSVIRTAPVEVGVLSNARNGT